MYYAGEDSRTPKKKVAVTVVSMDGEVSEGYFFVAGIERISDILNEEQEFVPFDSLDGSISILNRRSIGRVLPRGDAVGDNSAARYAQSTFKLNKKKSAVSVITVDGAVFEGHFYVGGLERISDMLNRRREFIPFDTVDGATHIFNRHGIARVVPREDRDGASDNVYYAQAPVKLTKQKTAVSVVIKDGETLEGHVFVSGAQRVSDLLNGDYAFLPFESGDGTIQLVNRSVIGRVAPEGPEGEAPPVTDHDFSSFAVVTTDAAASQEWERQDEPVAVAPPEPARSSSAASGLASTGTDFWRIADADRDRSQGRGRGGAVKILAFACLALVVLGLAIVLSWMEVDFGDRQQALPDYRIGMAALATGDYEAALGIFEPLAEHGVAKAQTKLALMYENGQGVPRDYDQARKWYLEAAQQGNVEAQLAVGFIYHRGQKVTPDPVRAHSWFSLAAEQGNSVAANERDRVAAKLSGKQIDESKRLVRAWREGRKASQ
ncbi:MAG: tetratricopeptide repeat protein [Alphaproteobacteria bacterium]|jgi:hypothetical protein|nr:tetratricopeptide repeat protein [Alphaproteobacteria bacterium]